ncbi:serine/threonine-protein kinase 4 homolog B-like [Schistocerca gregaria]|uniref:serine/threonine-protein kinase 4 homolog B-like n=1 Tax=Schistocerca gregaria TaxID=7010 RepID=UPI00211E9B91|nr:serine/threonine-protein kinase 4 homolog B-like [Schistocerca gregaria]
MESTKNADADVFEFIELLGIGSCGEVWKVRHRETSQILAIKKILSNVQGDVRREIEFMSKCSSPHIVRYYGTYYQGDAMMIVMEYFEVGSVNDAMALTGLTLGESQIAAVCRDVLGALIYLNERNQMHRDIKPHNVLLNIEGKAKLADFGIARELKDETCCKTVIGTPYYLAPEVIRETGYDYRADIWSLGISAIEMAERNPPYADLHPMRALFILGNNPMPKLMHEEHWSPEFNDFVTKCLNPVSAERPRASELINHAFIEKSSEEALAELVEAALEVIERYGNLNKALEEVKKQSCSSPNLLFDESDVLNADIRFDTVEGDNVYMLKSEASRGTQVVELLEEHEKEAPAQNAVDMDSVEDLARMVERCAEDLLKGLSDQAASPKVSRICRSSSILRTKEDTKYLAFRVAKSPPKMKIKVQHNGRIVNSEDHACTAITDVPAPAVLDWDQLASIRLPSNAHNRRSSASALPSLNLAPDSLPVRTQRYEGAWSCLAEGLIPFRNNPQYILSFAEPTHCSFAIHLNDSRVKASFGFHLVRVHGAICKLPELPSYGLTVSIPSSKRTSLETHPPSYLEPRYKYIAVPVLSQFWIADATTPSRIPFTFELRTFNLNAKLTIQPAPPMYQVVCKGSWTISSSGGCINHPTWRSNPQMRLVVRQPTTIYIFLSQSSQELEHIGCYVIRSDSKDKLLQISLSQLVNQDTVRFRRNSEFSTGRLQLAPGTYILIPASYHPGHIATFTLTCVSERDTFSLEPIPELWSRALHGHWTPELSGGCINYVDWVQNPTYQLLVKKQITFTVIISTRKNKSPSLRRRPPQPTTKQPIFIGFYIFKRHPTIHNYLSISQLIAQTKAFIKRKEIIGVVSLKPGNYVLLPCTFSPGVCSEFVVSLYSTQNCLSLLPMHSPQSYFSTTGSWTPDLTAGGSFSHPTWRMNTQYLLVPQEDSSLIVRLEQAHENTEQLSFNSLSSSLPSIGLAIFCLDSLPSQKLKFLSLSNLVHMTPFMCFPRIETPTLSVKRDAPLLIVPMTLLPNVAADYKLIYMSHCTFQHATLDSTLLVKDLSSSWSLSSNSCGGSLKHGPSWLSNPKFTLHLQLESSCTFLLNRPNTRPGLLPHAGLYLFSLPPDCPHTDDLQFMRQHLVQKSSFSVSAEISVEWHLASGHYLLMPATFDPLIEGPFRLAVMTSHPHFTLQHLRPPAP